MMESVKYLKEMAKVSSIISEHLESVCIYSLTFTSVEGICKANIHLNINNFEIAIAVLGIAFEKVEHTSGVERVAKLFNITINAWE